VTNELSNNFSLLPLGGGGGTGVAEVSGGLLLNATLAIADERANVSPYLAQSLPQLDTSSWQLAPDGSMVTTYTLKPNLTWHDGNPLTADDFAFAWELYSVPDFGVAASLPRRYMAGVEAPDPLTVVVTWNQLYVNAGRLQDDFPPLPRHILGRDVRPGASDEFINSSFWNQKYVGAGPYKLDAFTPGVSIDVSRFDGHVLGPAGIARVNIRGISDTSTAMASVLAGEVDFGNDLFRAEEGVTLERDWVSTAKGVVLWEPLGSRTLQFQFGSGNAQPAEIATDARVRQAIAHAINKQDPFDAVTGGHGIMSDTRTHPGFDYQPAIAQVVSKYPFDPARAEQLLLDAGFTRGSDRSWNTSRGSPAELPIWYTEGSSLFEHENLILVDQLKRFGFEALSKKFPVAGSREERAKLPGMIGVGSGDPADYRSINIPKADNRWSGSNRGAYLNPEMDRLADALDRAIAPKDIVDATAQIEKLVSSELPGIFLYWHSRAWVHDARLKGPTVRAAPGGGHPLTRLYKWQWTS